MKEYELQVLLRKQESYGLAEWHESTTVDAKTMAQAKKLAWEFARIEADLADAKITDAYAIDLETSEHSQ